MELVRLGSSRRAALGAGAFVLLGLAIVLIWSLVNFGGFGGRTGYFTELDDVSGLRTGANVEIGGFQIGTVRAIEPIDTRAAPKFRVALSVRADWALPVDTRAVLSHPNPLAAPVVALQPGTSADDLAPGATIAAGHETELPDQLAALLESANRLLSEEVAPMVGELRHAVAELNVHLGDNLPPILYDARHLLDGANATLRLVRGDLNMLSDRLDIVVSEDNVALIGTAMASVSDAAVRLDALIQRSNELLADAGTLTQDAGALVRNVDAAITESAPALATLAGDTQFAMQTAAPRLGLILQNLERATDDLAALMAALRANPAVLIGVEPVERGPGR